MKRRRFCTLTALAPLVGCAKREPEVQESLRMPTYPGAMVFERSAAKDGKSEEIYLETHDDGPRIVDYYVRVLKDDGWKVTTNSGFGMVTMIAAERRKLTIGVRVFHQKDRWVIHQSIQPRKNVFFFF